MRGRRLTAIIAAGLLALAAAGCGSDDALAPEVPGPPADVVLPESTVAPAADEDADSADQDSATDEDSSTDDTTDARRQRGHRRHGRHDARHQRRRNRRAGRRSRQPDERHAAAGGLRGGAVRGLLRPESGRLLIKTAGHRRPMTW